MGTNSFPPPGTRKSVQRGTILIGSANASQAATITSVNTAKADLRMLGFRAPGGTAPVGNDFPTLVLTNGTTITAERNNGGSGIAITVSWELTEWY